MFFSVALVHSSAQEVPFLTQIAHEVVADADIIHMVDEGMARMIDEAGRVTEPVVRRVCSLVLNAREAGAEAIVLTSPVIGSALEAARSLVSVPVLRLDEAMVELAVQFGSRIGVVAMTEVTSDATLTFLLERADARGRDITVETRLCSEAAAALRGGDGAGFDEAVIRSAEELGATNDAVVLADVMMHRVVHAAGERGRVPVISSPKHGFEEMAKRLNYFRR